MKMEIISNEQKQFSKKFVNDLEENNKILEEAFRNNSEGVNFQMYVDW